jgi:hypothetical protein
MNNVKIRKIGAVIFLTLAVVLFIVTSIHLIQSKLSLPSTWTPENEGRFVAYALEQWSFLFTIPIVISLLLTAYLIYPSKFEKFSTLVKILSVFLAIGGFGATIMLVTMTIINNFHEPYFMSEFLSIKGIFQMILMTSPFWIMGIFSLFAFKKIDLSSIKRTYKEKLK